MKKKREDRLHGARSEYELKQQLKEIEKAAQDAIATDRVEMHGNFYSGRNAGGPPPPPPLPLTLQGRNEFQRHKRDDEDM